MQGAKDFSNTVSKLNTLLNFFANLSTSVGILLLAWSIYQLILAFKDEALEPKVRAITMIVVAVLLITAKTWINKILEGTGVSI